MYCTKCGKKITEDSMYCPFCGKGVGAKRDSDLCDGDTNKYNNADVSKIEVKKISTIIVCFVILIFILISVEIYTLVFLVPKKTYVSVMDRDYEEVDYEEQNPTDENETNKEEENIDEEIINDENKVNEFLTENSSSGAKDKTNADKLDVVTYESDNSEDNRHENDDTNEATMDTWSIDIPDWYIVNGVAINGNELCFTRDDGLVMENGEYPLSIYHYIFSEDGMCLNSLKEYIICKNESSAKKYADELNEFKYDGRNSFGMLQDEAYYYSVGNVLVQVFLPSYIQKEYGTLQDRISELKGFGWPIEYIKNNAM